MSHTLSIAALGFLLCLLAMLALLLQLRHRPRRAMAAWAMAAAVVASIVWSACGLVFALEPTPGRWAALRWSELLHAAAWPAFVLVLLLERSTERSEVSGRGRFAALASAALLAAVCIGGLLPTAQPAHVVAADPMSKLSLTASLCLAIVGLVCVEQLLRNVPARQRWGIWPLAVALGGTSAFDLYLYSDAVLFGKLDGEIWSAQGAVLACAAPLLAVATARNQQWTKNLAVSHHMVFHSTMLLATATYVLGVAALGYLVRYLGGAWGPALQVVLLAAALMVIGALLTLGTLRAKLRVWIRKNFFQRRYDHREEWLRFTRLLSVREASSDIYVRCVQALADLVESTAGSVWIRREGSHRQVAQWNTPAVTLVEPADGSLAEFLERTGWVIDLREYEREPARYEGLRLPDWLAASSAAWLVLPLVAAESLTGFVVLMSPRVQVEVDWEVLDLLKTASCEVAVLLRQIEANDALAEAEKFAAISRLSAFMVHDLKNLVAQLSLMLKNAERHGDNPDFRRDMFETVQHVVNRMNAMLAQARLSTQPLHNPQALDVAAIVRRVCEGKRVQRSGLVCSAPEPVFAVGHPDRLEHVFAHVVQNAIDATKPGGSIGVALTRDDANAVIDVVDDGIGMSSTFVQQRLFRPFQTTKEAGMGIGVYESHQYVTSLGGQLTVESAEGLGTRVRIVLPSAAAAARLLSQPFGAA
ncbi:MAG TPA: XrtA/PEP-CTERM system histidine kinase PrsK [Burkholderiaceae bacterium]|nr:XrtA/PEP-CTERM system histidine kinase PrsK [Burkholderiaceae bacterium]